MNAEALDNRKRLVRQEREVVVRSRDQVRNQPRVFLGRKVGLLADLIAQIEEVRANVRIGVFREMRQGVAPRSRVVVLSEVELIRWVPRDHVLHKLRLAAEDRAFQRDGCRCAHLR